MLRSGIRKKGENVILCNENCFECIFEDCIATPREEVEKKRAYNAGYRQNNKEKIKAYNAKYYQNNKEERKSFNVKNKDREKAFYQAVLGKIEGFYFSYYDTTTTKTL